MSTNTQAPIETEAARKERLSRLSDRIKESVRQRSEPAGNALDDTQTSEKRPDRELRLERLALKLKADVTLRERDHGE